MKKIVVLIAVLLVVGWFANDHLFSSKSSDSTPAPQPPAPKTAAVKASPSAAATLPDPGIVSAPQLEAPAAATPTQSAAPQSLTYPQMSLAEVVKPGNVFRDDLFGVSATFPEGWSVKHAVRWGQNNRENTVFFEAPKGSNATPSMYYQKYPDGMPAGSPEAYLREVAQGKEASRQKDGFTEYQNDPGSFVYREVGGHPSLSYSATYITRGGEVHAEYITRILGPGGYVMFFVKGPAKDIQDIIPAVHQMSGTVSPP